MHYAAYEFPRNPIPRTSVNKGNKEGRVPPLWGPEPSPTALAQTGCLLEIEGFAPNYRSELPESVRLPSMPLAAWHRWSRCRYSTVTAAGAGKAVGNQSNGAFAHVARVSATAVIVGGAGATATGSALASSAASWSAVQVPPGRVHMYTGREHTQCQSEMVDLSVVAHKPASILGIPPRWRLS